MSVAPISLEIPKPKLSDVLVPEGEGIEPSLNIGPNIDWTKVPGLLSQILTLMDPTGMGGAMPGMIFKEAPWALGAERSWSKILPRLKEWAGETETAYQRAGKYTKNLLVYLDKPTRYGTVAQYAPFGGPGAIGAKGERIMPPFVNLADIVQPELSLLHEAIGHHVPFSDYPASQFASRILREAPSSIKEPLLKQYGPYADVEILGGLSEFLREPRGFFGTRGDVSKLLGKSPELVEKYLPEWERLLKILPLGKEKSIAGSAFEMMTQEPLSKIISKSKDIRDVYLEELGKTITKGAGRHKTAITKSGRIMEVTEPVLERGPFTSAMEKKWDKATNSFIYVPVLKYIGK